MILPTRSRTDDGLMDQKKTKARPTTTSPVRLKKGTLVVVDSSITSVVSGFRSEKSLCILTLKYSL